MGANGLRVFTFAAAAAARQTSTTITIEEHRPAEIGGHESVTMNITSHLKSYNIA